LDPTSVTAGASSTLTLGAGSATPGTYTVTVTGTGTSATHSTTVSLTVTAPPPPNDFSISANPTSLSLVQGQSGTSTISTALTSGSAETINLTVSGTPGGASAGLNPTSVTTGGGSTLTVGAGTATPGTYTLTVTATATSATHSTIGRLHPVVLLPGGLHGFGDLRLGHRDAPRQHHWHDGDHAREDLHQLRRVEQRDGGARRVALVHAHAQRPRRQLRDRPDVHPLRRRNHRCLSTAASVRHHPRRVRKRTREMDGEA